MTGANGDRRPRPERIERSPPAGLGDVARLRARLGPPGRVYVMSDFDGTLADITDHPDDTVIREDSRAAIEALRDAPGVRVALVSGRALTDLRERAGIDGIAYAGNHGLEIDDGETAFVHPEAQAAESAVSAVCDAVEARVGDVDGVLVERKGLSATVHWRRVEDADDAARVRAAVEAAVDEHDELEGALGKSIVEVVPAVDWDKGRAVDWLLAEDGQEGTTAVYVGDDTTDEDAFTALGADGVTVYVGEDGADTAAQYRVPDQAAAADFFAWIAALRS